MTLLNLLGGKKVIDLIWKNPDNISFYIIDTQNVYVQCTYFYSGILYDVFEDFNNYYYIITIIC